MTTLYVKCGPKFSKHTLLEILCVMTPKICLFGRTCAIPLCIEPIFGLYTARFQSCWPHKSKYLCCIPLVSVLINKLWCMQHKFELLWAIYGKRDGIRLSVGPHYWALSSTKLKYSALLLSRGSMKPRGRQHRYSDSWGQRDWKWAVCSPKFALCTAQRRALGSIKNGI